MREKRQQYFLAIFDAFTTLLLVWIFIEFFSKGLTVVPPAVAGVYLVVLAYYAGDKEIRRWRKKRKPSKRKGELFVYGWIGVTLLLFLIERLGGAASGFFVPGQLPYIAGSVTVIFIITEYLKAEFRQTGSSH